MVRDDDARHFADVRPPSAVEGYRELPLPEAPSLAKMVGPGIIAVGIGMAAGEFILWPFAVIRGGLGLLWLALVTLVIQVFINMEIERYTLATGETAVAGFTRLWKPIGLLICLAGLFQYVFPGWATSAAAVTAILTGGSVKWIAIGALVIVGLALTVSPVIYTLVERVEFFKVACTIVFLIVVVTSVISLSTWGEAGKSLVTNFGQIPEGISITLVLSLLGAAGAGGVHNLILSNWVRDKGYGMGAHVPKLVSPITGHEEPARGHAFHFPEDEANLSRWRVWWKRANIEHVSSFFVVCLITITIMSMLAYETVFGRTELGRQANAAFLEAQGEELGNQVGDWFKILFWVTCAISLFAAALGLLDVIGRLVSDVLKSTYLAENPISESRLYFIVVWGEIVLGSLILMAGLTQPIVLLTISTVAASVVTFFYTALLIRLNTSYRLPGSVRLRGFRLAMMCIAFLFYGFFATLLLVDQVRTNF
jgi:hypothetical protein